MREAVQRVDDSMTALGQYHRVVEAFERPAVPKLPVYTSVRAIVEDLQPSEPVFAINPAELVRSAQRFRTFPGRSLYAMKCNPHPFVLRTLFDAGITDFDVASLEEIRSINRMFGRSAGQFFNNPAKSRSAVREANDTYGLRFYTADTMSEVDKILEETGAAREHIIAIRLSTAAKDARYVLSTKFGASVDDAARMMRRVHDAGVQTGISFHVGSQCLAPQAFAAALALVAKTIKKAGVPVTVLNVGGGFPAPYPGDDVPALEYYFSKIVHGRRELGLDSSCMLLCEPGRSLVATAGTSLVQVSTRRDNCLFINDGVFGTLQELNHPKERRPLTLHKRGFRPISHTMTEFKIYGPTCDSNDVLAAPFVLPENVAEGDWIEVGMMGAYSLSMRTQFNGFHTDKIVTIGQG